MPIPLVPDSGTPDEECMCNSEASEFRSIAIEVPRGHLQEVEEGLQQLRRQFEAEIQSLTARLGTVERQLGVPEMQNTTCQDASPETCSADEMEGRSTPVRFEESAWNIPLVLGLADVGWFDNVFAVLLVLLNLLMQGSFSQILLSEYFMGEPFETKLQDAKTWRTSIAHDSRYLDLAGTSLVSRVCAGDGSLILSTVQATLVEQINDFLGLQATEFDFNFWQPGTLLCMLCILLWSLCVYKDTGLCIQRVVRVVFRVEAYRMCIAATESFLLGRGYMQCEWSSAVWLPLPLRIAGIEEDLACIGGGHYASKGELIASFGCLTVFAVAGCAVFPASGPQNSRRACEPWLFVGGQRDGLPRQHDSLPVLGSCPGTADHVHHPRRHRLRAAGCRNSMAGKDNVHRGADAELGRSERHLGCG